MAARFLVAIALLLVLPCLRSAQAGPATLRPNEPLPASLQLRLRKAIEKGALHLRGESLERLDLGTTQRAQVLADHFQFVDAALVTWVLRRAGLPPDHDDLADAWKILSARAARTPVEAGFLLMGLGSKPLADDDLAGGVSAAGPTDPKDATAFRKTDLPLAQQAHKFLLDSQVRRHTGETPDADDFGGWSGEGAGIDRATESVEIGGTYVALLGLEAAVRGGLAVPAQTWLDALKLLVGWQAPKGAGATLRMNEVRGAERAEWTVQAKCRGYGFAGVLSDEPTGADTAGAAVGLTICNDMLQKESAYTPALRQSVQVALRDALAWLQSVYSITKAPSKEKSARERRDTAELYHYDWLQALSRLCLHLRMRFIGAHDWYKEGVELLLNKQGTDGAWGDTTSEHAFAMLFLQRASIPSLTPAITPGDEAPSDSR